MLHQGVTTHVMVTSCSACNRRMEGHRGQNSKLMNHLDFKAGSEKQIYGIAIKEMRPLLPHAPTTLLRATAVPCEMPPSNEGHTLNAGNETHIFGMGIKEQCSGRAHQEGRQSEGELRVRNGDGMGCAIFSSSSCSLRCLLNRSTSLSVFSFSR